MTIAIGSHTFDLHITYGLAKKLRAEQLVDLLGQDIATSVATLLFDLDSCGRAFWLLIEQQAAAADVTFEQLIDGLAAADIVRIREALQDAVMGFIQPLHPEIAASTLKLVAKQQSIASRQAAAVVTYLDSDRIDRQMEAATERLFSEADAAIDRALKS